MSFFRRTGANILNVIASALDPAAVASQVQVYSKVISDGTTQLFARDSAGNVYQLTPPGLNGGITISPAAIAGNNDNYNPAGLATATTIRQDLSAAATLTGLVAQSNNFETTIINISQVQARLLRLNHDVTSTAANRFLLPSDLDWIIPRDGSIRLRYDSTSSRWRAVGMSSNVMPIGSLANPGLQVGITPTRGWFDNGSTWDFANAGVDRIQISNGFVLNGEFAQSGGQFTADTGAAALNLFGTVIMDDAWWLQGASTPAAFAGGTVNDKLYAVHTSVIIQDVSAPTVLTGITDGVDGRLLFIFNIGAAANTITLTDQDPLSTAANRLILPSAAPLIISGGGTACLRYQGGGVNRWRVLSAT